MRDAQARLYFLTGTNDGGDFPASSAFSIPFRVPLDVTLSKHYDLTKSHQKKSLYGVLVVKNEMECRQGEVCELREQERCGTSKGDCLEVPFNLGSTLRQIVIFTDKTHYLRGENGTYYMPCISKQVSFFDYVKDMIPEPKEPSRKNDCLKKTSKLFPGAWNCLVAWNKTAIPWKYYQSNHFSIYFKLKSSSSSHKKTFISLWCSSSIIASFMPQFAWATRHLTKQPFQSTCRIFQSKSTILWNSISTLGMLAHLRKTHRPKKMTRTKVNFFPLQWYFLFTPYPLVIRKFNFCYDSIFLLLRKLLWKTTRGFK